MKDNSENLEKQIAQATGLDKKIDREIAAHFDGDDDKDAVPPFTASVDDCIALVKRTLPDWHWHVGHGPMGIIPYASMSLSDGGDEAVLVEATAPTVPLALLGALMKASKTRKSNSS